MLDDFKKSQSLAYNLLTNSSKKGRISHAYLIDGNNNELAFDFVMGFVKMLICDYNYTDCKKCGNCNKCTRLDNGNYTDVKVIETDGLVIRKEQLLDLQNDFSMSSIEGNKRIYVIKDCDKMNKHASNCLLKFLEEPNDNIIAILFTDNVSKLLPTIISRCQFVRLFKEQISYKSNTILKFANICCNSLKERDLFLKDESNINKINHIIDFISYYEENGLDLMIYLRKMWYNNFSERDDYIIGISLMINFYYDVFKFYFGVDDYFFVDYLEKVRNISILNNSDIIIKKIGVCIEAVDSLKNNLNINLVIDNLLLNLEESKYGNS